MRLNRKIEQQIIDQVQDKYDTDNPFYGDFSCKLDFGTFNLYVYEIKYELFAIVERKLDGKQYKNIENYIENELLDKHIKL